MHVFFLSAMASRPMTPDWGMESRQIVYSFFLIFDVLGEGGI